MQHNVFSGKFKENGPLASAGGPQWPPVGLAPEEPSEGAEETNRAGSLVVRAWEQSLGKDSGWNWKRRMDTFCRTGAPPICHEFSKMD
jgi:hypothetical protein